MEPTTTRRERIEMADWEGSVFSDYWQTKLLRINRSNLYYKPVQPPLKEVAIKSRIDDIFTKYPYFGSLKIADFLKNEGVNINRKRVQRHMREMGIRTIYPYLLKGVTITRLNQVRSIDIIYIHLQNSWMYLTAIMDWYFRYIIC